MPSAPPDPPSPTTAAIIGTRSPIISRRFTAIASEMWRSSDPIPGNAPGVSIDVIERERPLHMARDLDTLPGSQGAVNLASRFAKLCLHYLNGRIKIDIVLIRVIFQILQPPFQFKDRFFKIEWL